MPCLACQTIHSLASPRRALPALPGRALPANPCLAMPRRDLPCLPCSGGFPPPDLLCYYVKHPVLSIFLRAPFADADAETGKVEKVDELLKADFISVVLDW